MAEAQLLLRNKIKIHSPYITAVYPSHVYESVNVISIINYYGINKEEKIIKQS